ncbi:hypothetical protein [Domibacillus aminovorans]|uniref:Uncharacterized protein n=1 Tax=Domibacillus aminovorans TaxID=29332 RepID=A0A177L3A0_9BACI|nr:hypothetical protein [Domibacillus aminovorans]OAH59874.1 hypothetical protein AWH49_18110 [Domibacillus aminovorans]
MKWQEVRDIYPDQYVLLSILDSHLVDSRKIVDEVALIRPIDSAQEATSELLRSKGNTVVYHTSNETFIIDVRKPSALRGITR